MRQRKTGRPRLKDRILRSSDSNEYNNNDRQQENLSRIYSNQQQNGKAIINTQQNVKLKTTMRRGKYAITENDETFPYDKRPSDVSSDSDTDDGSDSMKIEEKKKKSRRSKLKKGLKTTAAVVGSSTSVLPFQRHHHHHHRQLHNPSSHHLHTHHYMSPQRFNEDKPWKSHRDVGFITEQERKRYESMWVSNRYLYLRLLSWWPTLTNEDNEHNLQPLSLPRWADVEFSR